jgi:hypothetical protein
MLSEFYEKTSGKPPFPLSKAFETGYHIASTYLCLDLFSKPYIYPSGVPELLMDLNIITGIILTVIALGTVVILTLWSRRIIERIHTHSPGSLRKIQKDIINGNGA